MLNSCSNKHGSNTPLLTRAILVASIAATLGLAACKREPEPAPERVKQVFHLSPYEKDFGYSQAVLIDKTLYISGTVSVDEGGRLVAPGDTKRPF